MTVCAPKHNRPHVVQTMGVRIIQYVAEAKRMSSQRLLPLPLHHHMYLVHVITKCYKPHQRLLSIRRENVGSNVRMCICYGRIDVQIRACVRWGFASNNIAVHISYDSHSRTKCRVVRCASAEFFVFFLSQYTEYNRFQIVAITTLQITF